MADKSSSGIRLLGFIFIVFLILKLANIGVVAKWSWWYVTAPLWWPICAIIIFYLIFLLISVFKKY